MCSSYSIVQPNIRVCHSVSQNQNVRLQTRCAAISQTLTPILANGAIHGLPEQGLRWNVVE